MKHFMLLSYNLNETAILFSFCTISDECPDDNNDTPAPLPPPEIEVLRRGSSAELGSNLMPSINYQTKTLRHSKFELEHEPSAPQTPHSHVHKRQLHKGGVHHKGRGHHATHGLHRVNASKKSIESAASSSILSSLEDEHDDLEVHVME